MNCKKCKEPLLRPGEWESGYCFACFDDLPTWKRDVIDSRPSADDLLKECVKVLEHSASIHWGTNTATARAHGRAYKMCKAQILRIDKFLHQ